MKNIVYVVLLIGLLVFLLFFGTTNKQVSERVLFSEIKLHDTVLYPSVVPLPQDTIGFAQALAALRTRSLPLTDDTSFDSFIEAEDYKEVAIDAFQLKTIYPNFDTEGYNYRAIAAYRISFSEDFHSVVITVKKGDNEMESVLINYDISGNIIANEVISYDEIAEGQFRITAKVTQRYIEKSHISWATGDKQVTKKKYAVVNDGSITEVLTNEALLKQVVQELGLENEKLESQFLATKIMPNSPEHTIMVIPQLTYKDETEDVFTLDVHVVLVHNTTAKITNHYLDAGWTSNAILLDSLIIDTAPYVLAENTRAFGIRINFLGMSRPSPFSEQVISLFVPVGDTLKKVLPPFDVMNYGGEWDMVCAGAFVQENSVLSMAQTTTNGYADIRVTTTIKETNHTLDANGECITSESKRKTTSMLTFDGEVYQR